MVGRVPGSQSQSLRLSGAFHQSADLSQSRGRLGPGNTNFDGSNMIWIMMLNAVEGHSPRPQRGPRRLSRLFRLSDALPRLVSFIKVFDSAQCSSA
jgi:hypothetical protein